MQDGGRSGMRCKGPADLNVYRHQQEQDAKVREDLNVQRLLRCIARDRPSRYGHRGAFFSVPCEGQALALRAPRRVFFRSAGACPPRPPPHPVHPVHPGHPASDARDIKVLADLFSWLRLQSIDMKVFQTFAPCEKNAPAAQPPRAIQNAAAGPRGLECL